MAYAITLILRLCATRGGGAQPRLRQGEHP